MVAWPSGLRRWFKAPVISMAWVRIPPLPNLFLANTVVHDRFSLLSTSVSVCFRGISRLPSAFVFLRWFKLAHISIQVCIRFYLNKDWGCVLLREIDFLLKICWSIPCLHPSWKVHTWTVFQCRIWCQNLFRHAIVWHNLRYPIIKAASIQQNMRCLSTMDFVSAHKQIN